MRLKANRRLQNGSQQGTVLCQATVLPKKYRWKVLLCSETTYREGLELEPLKIKRYNFVSYR